LAILQRAARAATWGLVCGCAAGLLTALNDFGAHWLWLDRWADRAGLGLRLIAIQAPLGAIAGSLIAAALGITEPLIDRGSRGPRRALARLDRVALLQALRSAVLLAPIAAWLGTGLFRGGMMSRLPHRGWLEAAATFALLASGSVLLYVSHRLEGATRSAPRARRGWALAAAVLAFALAKLNQWLLPKLYDDLHAALSLGSFALWAGAAFLFLTATPRRMPLPRLGAWRPWLALTGGLGIGWLCLAAAFARLDVNQNVRVALLDPNVPHSRSLMLGLAPWVLEPAQRRATSEARRRASQERQRRTRHVGQSGPVLEDAHILLITVDALRADHLGTYGYGRPTSPNLDRMADTSVVFERAYAPAPHSSFSLSSLMASEYLHETLDLGNPAPTATLATELSRAGYHTAAFYTDGIFHTAAEHLRGYERDAFGFALHDSVKYSAEALTDRVLAEVDRTMARGEPSSLFWVHYFDVHEPYQDTYFGRADMDRYDSEIRHVDAQLERLIREFEARVSRQVIVVISADHGEEFHEHGGVYHGSSLYDEQVRIPLIVRAPGLSPRRVAAPVASIDIAPTLLEWVGLQAPSSMRGADLRAAISGQSSQLGPVFSAVIHKKMIVKWPYKLIADLRFGLFELYDLQSDPHERVNLADRQPGLLTALREQIYTWLDSLVPQAAEVSDPNLAALDWGRLGDRRAVDPLSRMLVDHGLPEATRLEAARILGHLADDRAAPGLATAMQDATTPAVAAESAIALGRMFDPRAAPLLQRLVTSEDPALRVRAGVSLGRLRDTRAVPALIEALWIAPRDYERQEAVRWLGRLGDLRALEPMIRLLPEVRTRYLVPVAIGMLGDARGFPALAELLTWDEHADVRSATVQGLGLLGDPRAIELLVPLAADDASPAPTGESLVRLGAIRRQALGGVDFTASSLAEGDLWRCHVGPLRHDWDFEHRTHCETRRASVGLRVPVPRSVASALHGAVVALAIKRVDAKEAAEVQLTLGSQTLDSVQVDASWQEPRWTLPAGRLQSGPIQIRIASTNPKARFALDHLLLIPKSAVVVAHKR
jgi:arylsulfatase A-like enzyme